MTNDCNLACPYCYVQKDTTYMTFEVGKKAIDYCHNNLVTIRNKYKGLESKCIYNGDDNKLRSTVSFFGGEPLLNFEVLAQIVEYAEETYPGDWYFNLTTNGILLTEKICQFLSKYNFYICLSWDGVKEDQDRQRPYRYSNQSSYDILMQKIQILLNNGPYSELLIRSTITQDNIKNFYKSYKLFESYNFDKFAFDLEYFTIWNEDNLSILQQELEKIYRDRALLYWQGNPPKIDFCLSTEVLKEYFQGQLELLLGIPIYIKKEPTIYTNCGYGLETVVINGKGNFYPCHEEPDFFNPKYSNLIGNLDTGINLKRLEELRNNIKQVEQKFLDNRKCYEDCILKQNHMHCHYTSCPANLLQTQHVTTYNCIIRKYCLNLLLKYGLNLYRNHNPAFISLLETYPTYQVYKDILAQPEGPVRDMYIQRYKSELIYLEQE